MSNRLPNAVDLHVASRLRLRRQEVGISLETLADALGVTYQQVQKYEKGTNRMSAGILYQMAMTLEVPVQYFFDELTPQKAAIV
jgi:transcriptional regulator with XRE-family HTH domain